MEVHGAVTRVARARPEAFCDTDGKGVPDTPAGSFNLVGCTGHLFDPAT